MAKSIRSKQMKRHRAVMRKTVGEAQAAKQSRHALRRLKRAVAEQETAKAEGAAPAAGTTLSALGAALRGGAAAAPASSSSSDAVDAATAAIAVPAGPPRNKKLRYTFNSKLRETRVAADIEDLTDDEDDVRLGRVDKLAKMARKGAAGGDAMDADDDDEEEVLEFDAEKMGKDTSVVDFAEIYGVKKAADKSVAKRGALAAPSSSVDAIKDTYTVGFYDSDPVFKNGKRQRSHRKGQIREKIAAAAVGKPKK